MFLFSEMIIFPPKLCSFPLPWQLDCGIVRGVEGTLFSILLVGKCSHMVTLYPVTVSSSGVLSSQAWSVRPLGERPYGNMAAVWTLLSAQQKATCLGLLCGKI